MRITDYSRMLAVKHDTATTASRLADASRHASAGARVLAPSDGPAAYASFVQRGSVIANIAARTRTARTAADQLSVAEGALDSATDAMSEARSLAVQGSNEALNANDRAALAQQVTAIRDRMVQLMNTRGVGGYVFGGSRTDTPPFDASGAFVGNDNVLRVPVADGVTPKMNVSGAKAFTAAGGGGVDALAALSALATALETGDLTAINASIGTMQTSHDQIVRVQVDAGLSIEQLRSSADVLDGTSSSIAQTQTRDVGGDDLAGLATDLQMANNAYSQSLQVTRKLLTLPSLAGGG